MGAEDSKPRHYDSEYEIQQRKILEQSLELRMTREIEKVQEKLSKAAATTCSYCKVTLGDYESPTSHLNRCEFQIKCPKCCKVVVLKNWHSHQCHANGTKVECSYCNNTLVAREDVASHLQKCKFPVQCPKCTHAIPLKNWRDHKCQATVVERIEKVVTTKCAHCKRTLGAHEDISFHLQTCTELPLKCPKCNDAISLKNWPNHKCQMTGTEATEKLLSDFKSMMLSGDHSDAVIRVKGEEFRLHRSVLASRSPYFHSMFHCCMKEKNTGTVTIDDCEPDVFRSYIHFVYTGKVDKLTVENVCELYELADKYQEDQLKRVCLHFMMSTLSVESFCDFIVLAFRHDERELLESAIKFFAVKMKEVILTVKWQALLVEYPTQANELLIKALY